MARICRTGLPGLLVLVPWFFLGCGLWVTRGTHSPGITKSDYKEMCGQCHNPPKPRSKTDREWREFMMQHRFVSGHDEETAQLFIDYLAEKN